MDQEPQLAEKGRMAWQNASGYNMRAKVEAAIGRWKQVIGDGLRSRMDERRVTERRHDRLPITKTIRSRPSSHVNGIPLKDADFLSSGA